MAEWWVYIDRDQGEKDVALGPYKSEKGAERAGNDSLLVDYLLSPAGGGGTDCYWSKDKPSDDHDIHIIDLKNPDHTGKY